MVFVVVLYVCRLVVFVKLNKLSVLGSWGAGQKFLEWGSIETLCISWLWIGIVPFKVIPFRAYTLGPLPQPPQKHLWNFVLWCCPAPPLILLNCKWHKSAMFCYSHTYNTNLQSINSAVLSDAQVHYIHLALCVGSLETYNMHLVHTFVVACETVIPLVYVL